MILNCNNSNNWLAVECNLCGQIIPVDKDFRLRKWKHEEHHHFNKHRKSQNRIIGEVEWLIKPV